MIFAPSTPSLLPPMLQTRIKQRRQGVLTVKTRSEAAYLTLVSVLLTLSASAMYIPSSGPTKFSAKLQTRIDQTRQGALTVRKRCAAAYLSSTNVEFVLSASEM